MKLIDNLGRKLFAVRHKAHVRTFSRFAPLYVVNEYPKCGGTWLGEMLSQASGLPFRRNQSPRFESAISHGHFLNPIGLKNTVVMWRDPRDMIVSFYFHSYFVNEHKNAQHVFHMKNRHPFDDYDDIQKNLPRFIEILSHEPFSPSFSWLEFAKIWADRPGTVQTSYEALRADTPGELKRVTQALMGIDLSDDAAAAVADSHSFARAKAVADQQKRSETQMSFVREGSLGGWKKHFTPEAEQALDDLGYRAAMQKLGYL